MIIDRSRGGYRRDGAQWCAGDFLIVFCDDAAPKVEHTPGKSAPALVACVRYAHMSQLGHWMMARVRVGPRQVSLSGAYGGDGLPCTFKPDWPGARYGDIPDDVRAFLHPVPDAVAVAFWNGGGHNCAGPEAVTMRAWAREHIRTLRRRRV